MKTEQPTRKQLALRDVRVRKWFEKVSKGQSPLTADVMVRGLSRILEASGLTVDEMVTLARKRPEKLAERFESVADEMEKRGGLPSSIVKVFASVKSFLGPKVGLGIPFTGYPRRKVIEGVSIRAEVVPDPVQLGRVLAALPLRWRAAALLMSSSGIRPGVIALHAGIAPPLDKRLAPVLQLRHLPDLETSGSKPTFRVLPFRIDVPPELSKTSNAYTTFGTPEAAKTMLRYFEERIASGETLHADSPVIAGISTGVEIHRQGQPVVTETLTYALRRAMRSVFPDLEMRPYVLRAYASTRLTLAEHQSGGKVTRSAKAVFLGHDLGTEGRYDLSKKLSAEVIEDLRAQYSAAVPFLETSGQRADNRASVNRTLLEGVGYTAEDAAKHANEPSEVIVKLIGDKLRPAELKGPARIVVAGDEAKKLMLEGWNKLERFDDGSYVLARPDRGSPAGYT